MWWREKWDEPPEAAARPDSQPRREDGVPSAPKRRRGAAWRPSGRINWGSRGFCDTPRRPIWCGPRLAAARTRQGAEPGSRHRIQGSFVKVILDKIGDDELIAYVPDRVFYRDPFSIGDVVIAGWEKDKTRMLARN